MVDTYKSKIAESLIVKKHIKKHSKEFILVKHILGTKTIPINADNAKIIQTMQIRRL